MPHARALQCASPTCPPHRGRHTDCPDNTDCRGCLPRIPADGIYLCDLCARLLAEDPTTLTGRHQALGHALTGTATPGAERVTAAAGDPNLRLNMAAVDARTRIRDELGGLARLITTERGTHLPTARILTAQLRPEGLVGPMPLRRGAAYWDTRVPALAALITRHARWLAAHPAAGEHAQTLRNLVRDTYGVAYPSGVRVWPVRTPGGDVASCPELMLADGVPVPCPGWLWTVIRPRDDRLPAELLCNHVDSHRWPASTWLRLGARLARMVAESTAVAEAADG
jgi:hypothetical protein